MNKQLIRDLAITGGIYDSICDPYDKLENGDYYSSVMVDLERFAEKIVAECVKKCEFVAAMAEITNTGEMARKTKATADSCAQMIGQHFGVEE